MTLWPRTSREILCESARAFKKTLRRLLHSLYMSLHRPRLILGSAGLESYSRGVVRCAEDAPGARFVHLPHHGAGSDAATGREHDHGPLQGLAASL